MNNGKLYTGGRFEPKSEPSESSPTAVVFGRVVALCATVALVMLTIKLGFVLFA